MTEILDAREPGGRPAEKPKRIAVPPLAISEGADFVNKNQVRSRIEEIGIIPSVRVSSADDAMFAAEAVHRGGIPIVEVTLTVPGAIEVISHLVQNAPEMIVAPEVCWMWKRHVSVWKLERNFSQPTELISMS